MFDENVGLDLDPKCLHRLSADDKSLQAYVKQVAQWARIAHLRASIMFGDTIFYNAQKQAILNLKQQSGLNSNTRYYASSAYQQVLNKSELKWPKKPGKLCFQIPKGI